MSSSSSGTALTVMSRVTSDDYEASVKSGKTQTESLAAIANSVSATNHDRDLHGQIEDLLTALGEMQREHGQLATQLAKEREEREEDCSAVRSLLDGLLSQCVLPTCHSNFKTKSRRLEMSTSNSAKHDRVSK